MSVNIKINNALKKYGNNTIIPDLSIDVKKGEFFTLLGPSGCGKTTLLRMIAGFNTIEGGEFYFGDRYINNLNPSKRNIGMVFQNYAIFPHLTVRKNVEFGLRTRKLNPIEIKERADKFLKLMHIDEYADRLPERLSGGQQQRVALARALVIEPDVLLMDEPLSNLDAKLRVEMRTVIKDVQNKLNITTIYVTHDQEEAMAVSDRIAVMKDGIIQQIGSPKELYQRPKNVFVATFIGKTNIFDKPVRKKDGKYYIEITPNYLIENNSITSDISNILISVRPEDFTIVDEGKGIKATVNGVVFLGLMTHYFVKLETGENVEIIQESTIKDNYEKGSQIILKLNTNKLNYFINDGVENITKEM
ncbi:MAG: ABC transporter ATP-binding protein [Pleomorphochaeta sp.]